MAQPWKFHSLAVAVSSKIQGLGGTGGTLAGVTALLADDASALTSATFASGEAGDFVSTDFSGCAAADSLFFSPAVSASVSPFRKNSASLPSMRLMNTRKDLPSGPTATSSGVPWTRSTTGDSFTSLSQG